MVMHIYQAHSWSGELRDSVEMTPQWFAEPDIPYDTMWPDNKFWLDKVGTTMDYVSSHQLSLLKVLAGKKVRAYFLYNDCSSIARHAVEVVEDVM